MCDTLGVMGKECSWFAKNSDRSPNEPQVLEYHPAQSGLGGMIRATYMEIPQVEHTYGVLLSRPVWMWGAEMGVNEHGVCIGNEAVFTKSAYGKTGLTGMDLVRLALERSASAAEALQCIIDLLEQYGQGGNCGYDHDFFYDNSFLIQDCRELYVLETAGRQWVSKKYGRASISNGLTIGAEGDAYSQDHPCDFCRKYTEPVYTYFSGSKKRRSQTRGCLAEIASVQDCMKALRSHDHGVRNPFAQGSVSSACMHYGGMVGDHTTASMIVALEVDRIVVWATGSSTPCISLFKPWVFGSAPVAPVFEVGETTVPAAEFAWTRPKTGGKPQADRPDISLTSRQYWLEREAFHRSLIGKQVPESYYQERDALEAQWLSMEPEQYDQCITQEQAFYHKWKGYDFPEAKAGRAYRKRWASKGEALQ